MNRNAFLLLLLACESGGLSAESTGYGTVGNGRLEDAVSLPGRGNVRMA